MKYSSSWSEATCYRHAPWLNDNKPWMQSRSSSWLEPPAPAMKLDTSGLISGISFPRDLFCCPWVTLERLPPDIAPKFLLTLPPRPFDSLRTGRCALWEIALRRTREVRVPGIQFSLSESPHSSRYSSPFLFLRVFETFSGCVDGLLIAMFRSVSSLPSEETVRDSFRLFSPIC